MLRKFVLCPEDDVNIQVPKYYLLKSVNFGLWAMVFTYNGNRGYNFETTFPNIHNFLMIQSEQGLEFGRAFTIEEKNMLLPDPVIHTDLQVRGL